MTASPMANRAVASILEWVCSECQRISKFERGPIDVLDNLANDLNMDDLARVELFLAIEDHFEIDFANVDAGDTPTVGFVVNLVHRALAAKSGTGGIL